MQLIISLTVIVHHREMTSLNFLEGCLLLQNAVAETRAFSLNSSLNRVHHTPCPFLSTSPPPSPLLIRLPFPPHPCPSTLSELLKTVNSFPPRFGRPSPAFRRLGGVISCPVLHPSRPLPPPSLPPSRPPPSALFNPQRLTPSLPSPSSSLQEPSSK